MNTHPATRARKTTLGPTFTIIMLCLAGASLGSVAQTDATGEAAQIRQELQRLREDYEKRMQALEERLRRIEPPMPSKESSGLPITTNAPVVSSLSHVPTEATNFASQARQRAQKEFQRDTESREHALLYERGPFAERIEHVLQDFIDINGYFRAGYGRDDKGGPQVAFQAPGAFSKYRLGNEAENYGELTFGKNFYVPRLFKPDGTGLDADSPTGPLARIQATVSIYNPYQDLLNSGDTDFGLPEIWGSIGNVVASQPSMKFWAGSRYYRRHDIHISDFFFYNMSGTGGGIEDFQLPVGKLALAWIGASSSSGFSDLPVPDPANQAGFSKANWDLRWYDVPLPLGKGEFGLVYARADSGLDAMGNSAPNSDGVAFTFLHTRDQFLSRDGVNKFSLQLGTGAATTFTSGFETFATNGGTFIRPDDRNSWRFRATEHFTANVNDYFSIGPAVVYQFSDYKEHGGRVHWVSAGVRPVLHFNKYLSLAGEAGVDWVENESTSTGGPLWKLTLAPQVSLGGRFMSRPVIRAFVTYAQWADDFVGQVGGNDYQNASQGLTYGVQMEAWW